MSARALSALRSGLLMKTPIWDGRPYSAGHDQLMSFQLLRDPLVTPADQAGTVRVTPNTHNAAKLFRACRLDAREPTTM